MTKNILATEQREVDGARTFGKYQFQYHWALAKLIQKHSNKHEYALLIEYHEDVVFANSLDGDIAKFSFFQVKNQQQKFTVNSLTKREKSSNTLKNSVLGKLLLSSQNTKYQSRVIEVGLVSSAGFSLDLKENIELNVVCTGDLSADCVQKLTEKVRDEIGIEKLPQHLKFLVPEIMLENQEQYIISEFSKLMSQLFPGAYYNPIGIYQSVIDEMHRKGRLTQNFSTWQELIDKKSLTSENVNRILPLFLSQSIVDEVKRDAESILKAMGKPTLQVISLRNKFGQLILRRKGSLSAYDIELIKKFRDAKNTIKEIDKKSEITILDELKDALNQNGGKQLVSDDDELILESLYALLVGDDDHE